MRHSRYTFAETDINPAENEALRQELREATEEIRLQQIAIDQLRQQLEDQGAEVERLRAELAECEAAKNDFFDDVDRYARQVRQLEKQALTPERCDRILKALQSGQQSALYRRVAAVLVEIYGQPWR